MRVFINSPLILVSIEYMRQIACKMRGIFSRGKLTYVYHLRWYSDSWCHSISFCWGVLDEKLQTIVIILYLRGKISPGIASSCRRSNRIIDILWILEENW